MVRQSKTNFLDSLLGGFAQGLQLSEQFKDRQRDRDLKERKFGIDEQKLLLLQQKSEIMWNLGV